MKLAVAGCYIGALAIASINAWCWITAPAASMYVKVSFTMIELGMAALLLLWGIRLHRSAALRRQPHGDSK